MRTGTILLIFVGCLAFFAAPLSYGRATADREGSAEYAGPPAAPPLTEGAPEVPMGPVGGGRKPGRRGRGLLRGGPGLPPAEREEFRRMHERVRAKSEKIASLKEKMRSAKDAQEKENIRKELKEAMEDLMTIRMSLAERKSKIAKRLMQRALERYVEAEKELARLQARRTALRRMERRRRGEAGPGESGGEGAAAP